VLSQNHPGWPGRPDDKFVQGPPHPATALSHRTWDGQNILVGYIINREKDADTHKMCRKFGLEANSAMFS
jgi:hypothetical protein